VLRESHWQVKGERMKTYTISTQERGGECARVPLRRAKGTKDQAMRAAWEFSNTAPLCDVVLTQGSKHVITYRDGDITHSNGKEYKG